MSVSKIAWIAQKLLKLPPNPFSDRVVTWLIMNKNITSLVGRSGCHLKLGPCDDPDLKHLRSIVITGKYEPSFMDLMLSFISSGDSVVDIGANEGYFTVPFAKKVGEDGLVFACEPHPNNVKNLSDNIELNNLKNVSIIPKALGDDQGEMGFFGDRAWGTLLKTNYMPDSEVLSVEVDTLDHLIIDTSDISLRLIKIDVEGNEFRVIRGAKRLIISARPIVAFEVNLTMLTYVDISIEEVFSFFRDNNYKVFLEKNGNLENFEWLVDRVSNLIAIPNESLDGVIGSISEVNCK